MNSFRHEQYRAHYSALITATATGALNPLGEWSTLRQLPVHALDAVEGRIVDQLLESTSAAAHPTTIFLAGPPGAGKTTLQPLIGRRLATTSSSLQIDRDSIKEAILLDPELAGWWASLNKYLTLPLELAPAEAGGAVHQQAKLITNDLLRRLPDLNRDAIIDGTLRDPALAHGFVSSLAGKSRRTELVVLECDPKICVERCRGRWVAGRVEYDRGISRLGGRFVPEHVIFEMFDPNGNVASSTQTARELFAKRLVSGLTILRSDPTGFRVLSIEGSSCFERDEFVPFDG